MSKNNLFNKLHEFFKKNPVASGQPTTEEEVLIIQKKLNLTLNDEFKKFTMDFGGCVIGDKEIYGIHNSELLGDETIIDININEELFLDKNLVIGFDSFGNPIFIDEFGKIYIYDVDENNYSKISESFFNYLLDILEGL